MQSVQVQEKAHKTRQNKATYFKLIRRFLRRDATLVRYAVAPRPFVRPSVSMPVRHKSEFYQDG